MPGHIHKKGSIGTYRFTILIMKSVVKVSPKTDDHFVHAICRKKINKWVQIANKCIEKPTECLSLTTFWCRMSLAFIESKGDVFILKKSCISCTLQSSEFCIIFPQNAGNCVSGTIDVIIFLGDHIL
jgi:hypothetical protein